MDWRTVTGGCPLPWDVSAWGVSPLHRPSPSLAGVGGGGDDQASCGTSGLEWQGALDGLFPVSGGSVEKDCFEISNK